MRRAASARPVYFRRMPASPARAGAKKRGPDVTFCHKPAAAGHALSRMAVAGGFR
jgi:hypothetical protein